MKTTLLILCFFFIFGCAHKVSEEDLRNLNGYWEIQRVTFADGKVKEYKVNPSLDYIQIDGLNGFRKKVYPKFDGTYDTTNDAEFFEIISYESNFEFNYKNELSQWKETIISLSTNKFSVIDKENITYEYKRFEPINVQK
ncbi:MAG: hypothetical protein COC08_02655 [Maribacter sp.]|nr:MAG: hypothetical protein COC08_02655 [Maribacter sp.]